MGDAMTEFRSREECLASIVPQDLGAIEGLTFFKNVTRTISSEPDLVRIRDKAPDGKSLADIGYSPAKALAAGRLLIAAALRSDPTLRLKVPEDVS